MNSADLSERTNSPAPSRREALLCYVTDGGAVADLGSLKAQIARAISVGVDWIQIRENTLAARELFSLTSTAVAAAGGNPGRRVRIFVNDRLDVAFAARAAGVHLKESSISAAAVRAWRNRGALQRDFLVGASCHSLEGALAAERDGADYIFFGPVFATPSKQAFGPPQGIVRLAEIVRSVRIPVLAIGGITLDNAGECVAVGAAGIAAIRMFQQAGDLVAPVAKLRAAMKGARTAKSAAKL